MKLDIGTDDGTETFERVEYFEVRSNGRVYLERDGGSRTVEGDLYGGSDNA